MLVLALETATERASAALVAGAEVGAAWHAETAGDLCRRFAPEIARLVARGGLDFDEVELVAIGLGPGSFTSLRIGLATAKAVALAREVPLVGASSLEALAWRNKSEYDGLLCPILDAKRGDLYASVYRTAGPAMRQVEAEMVVKPEALAAKLSPYHDEPVTFFGRFEAEQARAIKTTSPSGWRVLTGPVYPQAEAIAELGRSRYESRGADELASLRPIYVRMSYAEERFDIDLGLR